MINVGIVGSTGYGGCELVRILLTHPEVHIEWVSSRTYSDQEYSDVYKSYFTLLDQKCVDEDIEKYLDNVDVVLHEMYHSATVPESAKAFAKKCEQKGVAFYFVTSKSSADYESASDIKDKIIYNSTLENAYAKILLSGK